MPEATIVVGLRDRVQTGMDQLSREGRTTVRLTPADFSSIAMAAMLNPQELASIFEVTLQKQSSNEGGNKIRFEQVAGVNIPDSSIVITPTGLPYAWVGFHRPDFYLTVPHLMTDKHIRADSLWFGVVTPEQYNGRLFVDTVRVEPDVEVPTAMGSPSSFRAFLNVYAGKLAINEPIKNYLAPIMAAKGTPIQGGPLFDITPTDIGMTLIRR